MDRVNIGIIGAGLIANLHSFSLLQTAKIGGLPVSLRAVADLDEIKAAKFAQAYGYEKSFGDARYIIDDPAIDAVYVCTPTNAHAELVEAAADAGKHIFCEKPLAFSAELARRMHSAVERAGVINQVGLVLRHAPIWNVLKLLVDRSENGFPITAIFRDDQCYPIKGSHPSTWRKDVQQAGAGTLLEHSIHDLDLLEFLFGPISQLRAHTSCNYGHPGIEDMGQVWLKFENEMTATLVSIWHDVLHRTSNRRIEVFFANAFFALENEYLGAIDIMEFDKPLKTIPEKEVLEMFWNARGIDDPARRELSRLYGCMEDYLFCQSILNRQPADPDFSVAVRAHEIIDACYSSAREKRLKNL